MKFVERRTREIGRYMTCIDRKSRMYSGLDRADPAKKENRCRRRHTTEGNERRVCMYCIIFIYFCSASHGMDLSEALRTTAIHNVSEFTRRSATCRQLQIKDLPKVPIRGG